MIVVISRLASPPSPNVAMSSGRPPTLKPPTLNSTDMYSMASTSDDSVCCVECADGVGVGTAIFEEKKEGRRLAWRVALSPVLDHKEAA